MNTALKCSIVSLAFTVFGVQAEDQNSFLSSNMYCAKAYLKLVEQNALESEIQEMASSCQAQHDRNLVFLEGKTKLDPEIEVRINANIKAHEKELARLSKLPGVSLGMSAQTVRNKTNWASPSSINRTITVGGTREQWVYDGGYLYFTNGKLTAIQDSK